MAEIRSQVSNIDALLVSQRLTPSMIKQLLIAVITECK